MRMPTIRSKQPCIHIMLVFSSNNSTASVILPFCMFLYSPSAACILNWIELLESIVASQKHNRTAISARRRIPLIRYLWHVVNGLNGTAAMSCHSLLLVSSFIACNCAKIPCMMNLCLFVCFSFEFLFLHKNAQNSLLYSHIDICIFDSWVEPFDSFDSINESRA